MNTNYYKQAHDTTMLHRRRTRPTRRHENAAGFLVDAAAALGPPAAARSRRGRHQARSDEVRSEQSHPLRCAVEY